MKKSDKQKQMKWTTTDGSSPPASKRYEIRERKEIIRINDGTFKEQALVVWRLNDGLDAIKEYVLQT